MDESKPRSPADPEVSGPVETPPDEMGTDTWAPGSRDAATRDATPSRRHGDTDEDDR